ncbi:MAG: hypothetical protein KAR45_03445, partial [Desulfobacteraceae bacterium]|nr:hypothetical protein [Desulfobacteraceae bacterium]
MKQRSLYKFGIIFLVLLGLIKATLCLDAYDQSTAMDILTEKEVIMALEKSYKDLKLIANTAESSTEASLEFKIITPPDGGRVITNMDQTHVTFSIDSNDKQSGIKMVCGTRITNISEPDFIHDD